MNNIIVCYIYSNELNEHYKRCDKNDYCKNTLPFIKRELHTLCLLRNREIQSKYRNIKNQLKINKYYNHKKYGKLYKSYSTNNMLKNKLFNQSINRIKVDLNHKHEKEEKSFRDMFYKKYTEMLK